jgi:HK97 family phage portal protein
VALADSFRSAITAFRGVNSQYPQISWGPEFTATVLGLSVEELWRTQPYLRTVVTFLARNIAQLGLHTFERVSETDRQRLRADPVALLLARPNAHMTTYELVYSLVADSALYDEAFWVVVADGSAPSGWTIQPISPSWVTRRGGGSVFAPEWIEFQAPGAYRPVRVGMADVLWFHGWNPGSPSTASSPVTALKQILAEQIYSQVYRQQIWQKAGRIGGVLVRPAGAKWDAKVRENFQRQWQAKYAGNDGAQAGGTPILEDGMTYQQVGFSAQQDEYVEGSKLSFATVASVYHVNPTMVGILDNANFSNVREFRKMLYGDTLGSTISMLEDRINAFLVPKVTARPDVYVEFNIAEKLQGNFEEQAAALSTSVGRPWMTADEARALSNMPSLGGDAELLVTPLNVLVGGQASPRDSGTQNETGKAAPKNAGELVQLKSVQVKADGPLVDQWRAKSSEVLAGFFRKQRGTVLSRLGAKAGADDWWDEDRWNRELVKELYPLAVAAATEMGQAQAEALGFTADAYNADQTLSFLEAIAISRAGAINSTTRDRIRKALEANDDPGLVFSEAEGARSGSAGIALGTTLAAFALIEATKQTVGTKATKTWLVTSRNPRSAHASMNGQTVGIEEAFSNGADWPGDPVLGAEGVSNCLCSVEITY